MDEVQEYCVRVLGSGDAAAQAAAQADAAGSDDRIERLMIAVAACRERGEPTKPDPPREIDAAEPRGLRQTVALELAYATAQLPQRQREALALRELLRLSHEQIASVMGIQTAAVASLLARARLQLRTQLRGPSDQIAACPERDRALAAIARRQDSQAIADAEEPWLLEHLGQCATCNRAHGAMLEASVCYRAWRADDRPGDGDHAHSSPSAPAGESERAGAGGDAAGDRALP
jgi:hypothetical protein